MSEPASESNSARPNAGEYPLWLKAAVWFGMMGMLIACLSRKTALDPDLFHELALIREAIQIGRIPNVDPFAYTPTIYPVVHHEWGTGAVLYLATISSHLGGAGLMLVEYALMLFIAIGSYLCARRRGASHPVISLFMPMALVMAWIGFSTLRAQVFTLAFLVGLQLLLTVEIRRHRWWIAVWLLTYVVWLNLHAGFLVGLGLFVIFTLEQLVREAIDRKSVTQALWQVKHLLALWFVMAALISVNPYGLDYYHYLWRAVLLPRKAVNEWNPLWTLGVYELLAVLVFSQCINLYALRWKGIPALPGIAMVLVPALLAFQHARHLSIYAVVWLCCAPPWIEQTALGNKVVGLWYRRPRWVCAFWLILGVLALYTACRFRFWTPELPTSPIETPYAHPIYPAGAVRYLADAQFRGNLYTEYNIGAFVTWKLYPAVRVSTDGRYEVAFPPGQAEQLEGLYRAKSGWQAVLARYRPDAILMPWWSETGKLLAEMTDETGRPHWIKVYQDDAYSIYLSRDLATGYPITNRTGEPIPGSFP